MYQKLYEIAINFIGKHLQLGLDSFSNAVFINELKNIKLLKCAENK